MGDSVVMMGEEGMDLQGLPMLNVSTEGLRRGTVHEVVKSRYAMEKVILADEWLDVTSPEQATHLLQEIEEKKPADPLPWHGCELFILYWWIVPLAQTDIFAMYYQTFTFDLFHRRMYSRFIHMRTIPANVVLTMVFFAQWELYEGGTVPFKLNGAFVLLMVLCVWYTLAGLAAGRYIHADKYFIMPYTMGMVWGGAVIAFCVVAWILATAWYELLKEPDAPWYNPMRTWANPLMWMYITSFIQGSSHSCEDIPPLASGCKNLHWEAPLHFYFFGPCWRKTLLCMGFPILSTFVAYISWPHLIGSVILLGMFSNGYLPYHREAYIRARTKILSIIDPPNQLWTD
eukprot:CAMPEP_0119137570 /NCGR_PEP_ID=MMETSP1310-20130426/23896_1 /TAXON_ID=464262 /ORGANISM="Genus nov. species nov., Strain RCC2339" /LENGTH=343 /DNA_ID=CAMNT_0007128673 /DNA_START=112 /DNA_END=1140 /DNA_ORIENTATION=+